MQKGFLGESRPTEAQLELINKYTKRKLSADEVYAFSVILCDNDIDRDFERFTPEALESLAKLYLGKPGIFDHSMKGKDQVARTFNTAVEYTNEKTADGKQYVRLKAEAYIPRTSSNEDLILGLDAGIYKEVSVGCSVGKKVCSVCGADLSREYCSHKAGELYGEDMNLQQCHIVLSEPRDAYEWSFVAVPAQRKAGVIKRFEKALKGGNEMNIPDIMKALGERELTLSLEQGKAIKRELESLKALAKTAEEKLRRECTINALKAFPALSSEEADALFSDMNADMLQKFSSAFESSLGGAPQLTGEKDKDRERDFGSFKI